MTDMEFSDVAQLMHDLWPPQMRKKTAEQIKAYQRVCGRHSIDRMRTTLRSLAERAKYLPSPGDLAGEIKRLSESGVVEHAVNHAESRRLMENARVEDRSEVERLLNGMELAELNEHKTQAIRDDWRLTWMAPMPANAMPWRSIISRRVKFGLMPSEPHGQTADEADARRPDAIAQNMADQSVGKT